MEFPFILCIFFLMGFLGISSPTQMNYDCICPGFRREVCSFGPSGNLNIYDNLCEAKCSVGRGGGQTFGILPRSACRSTSQPGTELQNPTWTTEEWIRDVSKEAKVWKQVNRLIVELADLSTGGAPPCICPGIERPACAYGPSGNIIKYDNLCSMACEASKSRTTAVRIGPCNLGSDFGVVPAHPGISGTSLSGTSRNEEKELQDWIRFAEGEIKFYRQISQAMDGLFIPSVAKNG